MWKADEVEARNSSATQGCVCAELWGAGVGREDTGILVDFQMCSFQRGSVGVNTALSLSCSWKEFSKTLTCSLMDWDFRIPGSGSCRNHTCESPILRFPFYLACKGRFPPSWGRHLFWGVEMCGPGRAGKCNSVCKGCGMLWKKIQGISPLTAGLPSPLNSENPLKWLLHEEASGKTRWMYFFTWQLPRSTAP